MALGGSDLARVANDKHLAGAKGIINVCSVLPEWWPTEVVESMAKKSDVEAVISNARQAVTTHGSLFIESALPKLDEKIKALKPAAAGGVD